MKIVKPMLLEYQEEATSEEGWIFEPKRNDARSSFLNSFFAGIIRTNRLLKETLTKLFSQRL